MLKALVVVRTLFLVFAIGNTARAMPWWTSVARTFDEQYARCSETVSLLIRAAWIAVGWIAFETIVGWIMVARARKPPLEPDLPKPGSSEPPFAPPSHR